MKRIPTSVLALFAAAGLAHGQQYTISTIAGNPQVQGYFGDGGLATQAQLTRPMRVSLDSKGNFYIGDNYSHYVRKVTASTGNMSSIAGNGTNGFDGDGNTGTLGEITVVQGIVADSGGNVYLADTYNARVRKVDSAGVITTVVGLGTQGYSGDGGQAASAQLTSPAGLAIDGSGNLYIADYGNSTVRKVTTAGVISTVAGTGVWGYSGDGGSAAKATLAAPSSLVFDAAGNLYIGDTANNAIRKLGTDGNISTVYTNVTPFGMALDTAGNFYVVDGNSNVVTKILPGGTRLNIAGSGVGGFAGDGGLATSAALNQPSGVAVDSSGNVYVADTLNQVIRLLTPVPFSVGNVSNAASGSFGGTVASVAPGEIVTLFGQGIGPATLASFTLGANGNFPTQVGGASVTFNGTPAPLIYTSSGVIAAIVPYAMANAAAANIAVTYQGKTTVTTTVPVVAAAPGIFTLNSTGSGQAAALNANLSVNGAANPAKAGTIVVLYVTGEGQTIPAGIDGKVAGATPPQPVLPVRVVINGQTVIPIYAGGASTLVAGVMQVNVQIPATAPTGNIPVQVSVGGILSPVGATIAVTQ